MNGNWEDALRADVEVPQVVEDRMQEAFAQVRGQGQRSAEAPASAEAPGRSAAGETAAGKDAAPKRGRGKLTLLQRPWFAAAAAVCAVVVVGGAFAAGTLAGGSLQAGTAPAAYTSAPAQAGGYGALMESATAAGAAEESADEAADEYLEGTEDVSYAKTSQGMELVNSPKSSMNAVSDDLAAAEDERAEEPAESPAGTQGSQKLVYTASVAIETTDFAGAKEALRAQVEETGSIVASEDESVPGSGDGDVYGAARRASSRLVMQVRVPADKYGAFVDGLSEVGAVVSRTSNVDNITRTYSETEARIEALEAQKRRLIELMKKASDVADMIEIEDSLAEVRSELTAEKNYREQLDTDVAYSTVTVTLSDVSERPQPSAQPTLPERIAQAFSDGAEAFSAALAALLVGIVGAWPFLLLAAVVAIIVVALMRRRKAHGAQAEGTDGSAEHEGGRR